MIYFDNAATTGKKPANVIRAVTSALEQYSANPGRSGHRSSEKTADMVFNTRAKVANFFGASGPEKVAFTENCTHSLNCVIKGLLKRGDHVVVSSLEHNAVMRPLYKLGVNYDVANVSLTDDNVTVHEFESKVKAETRLVICTGASNVLGKILPVTQIGKMCRDKGIPFAVDAAQTAGVIDIDMKKMNIDYLCVAPHKGLYAPMGVGILICENPLYNTIIEGGTGTDSANLSQPNTMPEQIESGTINVPGIMGISAGIDYVSNIGTEKIYKHEISLCGNLYEGLKQNNNIILYAPYPKYELYVPVISFNMRNVRSDELSRILNKYDIAVRSGLHCAPTAHRIMGTMKTGAVRVCTAAFNNNQEINYLLKVLKSIKSV